MRTLSLNDIAGQDLMPEKCFPIDAPIVQPRPAQVVYTKDDTPINIISFPFYKFQDQVIFSLLKTRQEYPDDVAEALPELTAQPFFMQLGKALAKFHLMNAAHPEFIKDAEIIARHCAISDRDPRKGENAHKVKEFSVNGAEIRKENPGTWTRFLQNSEPLFRFQYFKKSDLPRDLVIPA